MRVTSTFWKPLSKLPLWCNGKTTQVEWRKTNAKGTDGGTADGDVEIHGRLIPRTEMREAANVAGWKGEECAGGETPSMTAFRVGP